ncbi:hypothetical protein BDY24DRAFT_386685 [Mrakia frigida]|uniref:DNA-directed RNA polymerase III core subunit RPC11 n=1 Tax=Mrakia frigida TaxID=29902 RepID=UPI003FCBF02E
MIFCPLCANMLVISTATGDQMWACQACTYRFPIKKQVTQRTKLKRKEVDDVLGGAEAWDNVDRTEARCSKCDNPEAFWMQLQIRSADEPMTTFYRCTNCHHQWREN